MDTKPYKLMCVLAHPDDEALATGGILARYAASGVQTYLIMATRGERGWPGTPATYPGPQKLGEMREAELRAAARVLGLSEVVFLDYQDGDLDRADFDQALARVVTHVRRVRPDVVVTFDPNGMYGHPDHIAISQLSTTAVVAAADPHYHDLTAGTPHRVAKLYHRVFSQAEQVAYEATFGRLVMPVDRVERRFTAWPEWAITTRIETAAYWQRVWQAVACHRTQIPNLRKLEALPAAYHARLWAEQTFYRAMSLVNGGREVEDDLFAGLHERTQPERLVHIAQQRVAA